MAIAYTFSDAWTYALQNGGSFGPNGITYAYASYRSPATTTSTPSSVSPAAVSASTGVSPVESQYSLYGNIIPLSVFGVGRIGGDIISGPWISNGLASFIISFGVPADPTGTRTLREIAFDSEVVWTSAAGFSSEAFTFRFYGGTLTQAADALETTHFGADAVAYRGQILIAFENLPLANTKFGKIPYVAAVIADGSGDDVNLGEAFERLAYSPYVGYTSSQFETSGITDGLPSGGLIFAQDADFLSTVQLFARFFPSWDILQTDKLRIVDRGTSLSPDVVLDTTRLTGNIVASRQGTDSSTKDLILSTIDPDADYTIVPFTAQIPREPIEVTTSVNSESVFLPAIMDASMRASVATFTKYSEDLERKSISGTATAYGLEIEPGDLVLLRDLGNDFNSDVFRVTETTHGVNYAVEFMLEPILRCDFSSDPNFAGVVLLLGFEGGNGSTGAPGLTDESLRAHGTAGQTNLLASAVIDTGTFKFGAGSLSSRAGTVGIGFPHSDDWHLSSANSDQFTVETWIRFNTLGVDALIVGQIFSPGSQSWMLQALASGEFQFASSVDGTTFPVSITTSGAALVINTWYHIAVDKDATGKIRLYKNGVMLASATPSDSSMFNSIQQLYLLCQPGNNAIDGWIDEVRITKGIARYASDAGFVVPAAAFPRA